MKSELIPTNGDPPIAITKDLTVVGRREFCDVQLGHSSLSKRHCVLVRTDGLLMVRDLASTNGTKVNGQRVMWAALLPNDRLSLGRLKFRVYLGPDGALSPSEVGQRGVVERPAREPDAPPLGAAPPGFAAPSPLSLPALTSPPRNGQAPPHQPGPDLDILEGSDFLVDDEDDIEPFIIDLD